MFFFVIQQHQIQFVSKQIGRLNGKKATGYDGISAKVLKLARPVILKPLTDLINLTIERSEFHDSTKMLYAAGQKCLNHLGQKLSHKRLSCMVHWYIQRMSPKTGNMYRCCRSVGCHHR